MKKNKLAVVSIAICSSIVLLTSMMLPASKIRLELSPKNGATYKNSVVSDINMKMMGQDMKIHSEIEMQNEILDITDNSIALNYKITRFVNKMNIPGLPDVNYDSKNKTHEGDLAKQLASIYDLIVNNDFSMEISKMGKIIKQADFSKIASDNTQTSELNETMENLFLDFPDRELGIGDSWTQDKTMEGQVPMNIKTTYTVNDINSKGIVIDMVGKISPRDNKSTIDGQTNGSMTLDRKTCWLVSGYTNMDMKVTTTANNQTQHFDVQMKSIMK